MIEADRPSTGAGLGTRDRAVLVLLLIGAAIVRAIAWSRTAVLFNDGPIFLALAEALRAGRTADVLAHPQHPLYPALVAVVEALGVAPEPAAITVSIAGGLLAVAAVHRLAFACFGPAIAAASGAIVALHPWAVDFSADVMSDGLYGGLFLAGLAALVELLERPSAVRAAAFGLIAGLAYWTRPEGLVLVVAAVVLFALRIATRPAERRALVRIAVVFLALVALFVGVLRASEGDGGDAFSPTAKKSVSVLLEGGPSPSAIEAERSRRRAARRDPDALPLPEGSIRIDGGEVARPPRTLLGGVEAIARVAATTLSAARHEVVVFALLGIVLVARGPGRGPGRTFEQAVLVVLAVQSAVLVLLVWGAGYVSRRHALAAGLALAPLAALGWQGVLAKLDPNVVRRFGVRPGPAGAALLLVVVLLVSWVPRDLRARRLDRVAERRAAEWLAARSDGVAPVAAQKRRTAYYAGAVFVPIPDGRAGDLERQLRGRHAAYLIIDQARLGDHLGLAEGVGRWLVPLHVERSPDQEVVVLALTPPAG
ncbi:MAG: glycosyltransferase family 39 protein [Myxococcota bacterium]